MWKIVVLVACLIGSVSLQTIQRSPRLLQTIQPSVQAVQYGQPLQGLQYSQPLHAVQYAQPIQAVHVPQAVHVARPAVRTVSVPHTVAAAAPIEIPQPYQFSYSAPTEDGGVSSQQQSGDEAGRVTGSYSLQTPEGTIRTVTYTADELGFRADIQTNEPGTSSSNPADANIESSAPQEVPLTPQAPRVVAARPSVVAAHQPIVAVQHQPAAVAYHQPAAVAYHQPAAYAYHQPAAYAYNQPGLLSAAPQNLLSSYQSVPIARRLVRRA